MTDRVTVESWSPSSSTSLTPVTVTVWAVSQFKLVKVSAVVEALADVPIARVACGKYHSAALTASGDVYAWGLGDSGQLGLGKTKATTPTKVEGLSGIGVTQLSCGMYHTLALTAEGEVYSCGFGGSFFSGAGGLG